MKLQQRILRYFRSLVDTDVNLLGLLAFVFMVSLVIAAFWMTKDNKAFVLSLVTNPVGLLMFIAACYGISLAKGRGHKSSGAAPVNPNLVLSTPEPTPSAQATPTPSFLPEEALSPEPSTALSLGADEKDLAQALVRLRLRVARLGPPMFPPPCLPLHEEEIAP